MLKPIKRRPKRRSSLRRPNPVKKKVVLFAPPIRRKTAKRKKRAGKPKPGRRLRYRYKIRTILKDREVPPIQPSDDNETRRAFGEGYRKGLYDGGEAILDSMLPPFRILPEIPLRTVIEKGLEQLRDQLLPLMEPEAVFAELSAALNERRPLSVVRLGDGELLTLAQETVLSFDQVLREGPFLSRSGVQVPAPEARNLLAESIRRAHIVGVPTVRMPNFLPLLFPSLRGCGIDCRELRLTASTINDMLCHTGHLAKLTAGRRVLLVGNTAPKLAEVLTAHGVAVVDIVSPVQGMQDIPRVMGEIRVRDFDLALVSSGIPAVVIAERIATELGKVSIDFGSMADRIGQGEVPFVPTPGGG